MNYNQDNQKIIENLKERLKNNLPGLSSQLKMAPLINKAPFKQLVPGKNFIKSAILLLLCKRENSLDVLFTLRSNKLASHKGQISFPGGRLEKNETPLEAAIRETEEEVGINGFQIIGKLSDLYVHPSKNNISPYVAYTDKIQNLQINKDEVEEAFFYPLDFFLDEANKKIENWNIDKQNVDVPLWKIHKATALWGATAMILAEFIDIWKESV